MQSYFQYYAKLANQQNMLQDGVRTSTYNRAIAGKLSFSRKADHGDVLWMGSLKDEKPGKIRKVVATSFEVVATSFEVTWSPKKNHHFFELQTLILDRSSPPRPSETQIHMPRPCLCPASGGKCRWLSREVGHGFGCRKWHPFLLCRAGDGFMAGMNIHTEPAINLGLQEATRLWTPYPMMSQNAGLQIPSYLWTYTGHDHR